MKPQVIGDYEIGYEYVRLILRDGVGAEFDLLPDDITIPAITVGADGNWKGIVARLLHESFEFTSVRLGCRFYPSHDLANNSAAYMFMLDHQKYAECCARVADFLVPALPDLSKAWKTRMKKR